MLEFSPHTGETRTNFQPTWCAPVSFGGFPGGSDVENLPAMQETWVQSLSWEELLEKGIATCSSILAWRIPWTEEPGGL